MKRCCLPLRIISFYFYLIYLSVNIIPINREEEFERENPYNINIIRSMYTTFKIDPKVDIFSFRDVINENFFFRNKACFTFYIDGFKVSKINDEFISWNSEHKEYFYKKEDIETSNIISNFIETGRKYNTFSYIQNNKKKTANIAEINKKGLNVLEIREKIGYNSLNEIPSQVLSQMFNGCNSIYYMTLFVRGF